jgi:protein-S-isoprenylcysteine O-methyltransferase Ste14
MKLYENGTAYFLVMETTNKPTAYRAIAPAIIAAIIIAALVLAIVITIAVTVHIVTDFAYRAPGTAISLGLILLGIAGAGVIGFAIYKGTSVRQAVTGKQPAPKKTTKALATAGKT